MAHMDLDYNQEEALKKLAKSKSKNPNSSEIHDLIDILCLVAKEFKID